jgi:GNAT superfamily N-acetyltransferase
MPAEIVIQVFAPAHSRMEFTAGVRRIDDYFAHGGAIQEARLARLFVALDRPTRRTVLGFYAMHNMDIEAGLVPPPFGARLRRGSQIGAVYISILAVASAHQNRGIGALLLANALKRIRRLGEESGVWAVVLDPLNQRAEDFYRRHGFDTLVAQPRRLFLPVDSIP